MTETETTSALWSAEFDRMRKDAYHWTNNSIVLEYLYRQVSGENVHWLPWLMNSYFSGSDFDRALSIGCGDGVHEVEIMRSGRVKHLTGIDVSEGALSRARDNMLASGIPSDRFHFEAHDANRISLQGRYDIIFNIHSAHHVSNIEGLFDFVVSHLSNRGIYVFVEFVGPTQFQWTDRQLSIINRLVASLPASLRNPHHSGVALRPTLDDMNAFDPSESIRSSELLDVLSKFFDFDLFRTQNGAVIHQIYPLLNGARANIDDEAFDSVVKLLIEFEKMLTENGVISPDFVFTVCRPKSMFLRASEPNPYIRSLSDLVRAPRSVNTTAAPFTFAQAGEDLLIEGVFRGLLGYREEQLRQMRYLDIGGGFPIDLSNTYLFYRKYGAKGFVYEPIPQLAEAFRSIRPRDTVIEAIVSARKDSEIEFFLCDTLDLSSVKHDHIVSFDFLGHSLESKQILCANHHIDTVIATVNGSGCDLLSIDAEGLDGEIIRAIPLDRWRPKVIVFEKDAHFSGNSYRDIVAHLAETHYATVAETEINVILADQTEWPLVS